MDSIGVLCSATSLNKIGVGLDSIASGTVGSETDGI